MTPEERFERIERNLEQITATIAGTTALAQSNEKALAGLAVLAESNQVALGKLIASVNAYVDSSNAYVQDSKTRMAQMEANLDNLIRILTAEHSNGKNKQ